MKRFDWTNSDANFTFLRSVSLLDHSNCSAVDAMKIHLGKAQVVKAIDDGGVSMYFRRDPSSTQQSRRTVLSVEVTLFPTILKGSGKTKKACQGKR